MAIFSDYVRKRVPFLGGTVELEIRALDKAEAPDFRARAQAFRAEYAEETQRRPDETDDEYRPRLAAALKRLDDFFDQVFSQTLTTKTGEVKGYYVRLVEPLINEDDDARSIRTMAELLARAPRTFKHAVLYELNDLIEDDFLGNSSGSPSTSTSAAGPKSSGSPAPTTEPSATSPSSSTATEAIAPAVSSTPAG